MPIALIILVLLGATDYYIAWRLHCGVLAKVKTSIVFEIFIIFTLMTIWSVGKAGVQFMDTVSAYWMGAFVYLMLFFFLAEIIALVAKLFKVDKKRYWFIASIAVIAATILTVGYGIYNARQIDNIYYEIQVDKADISDMNIVMISDVHLGAEGSESRTAEIVSRINDLKPDVVCIAGDFFDTDFNGIKDPEKALAEIQKISSTFGVYMCLGNHDAGDTLDKMIDFAKRAGITLLNDEYVVIDNRLVLAGRLDGTPIGGYGNMKRKELSEFLKDYDKSLPVVVMDHNPINIDTYTNEVDLILSGHTHKGQIFPFSIATDLMYTVDHGYYRKDEDSPNVIVTSGVGYWGLPMRVGTDSEIISIKVN